MNLTHFRNLLKKLPLALSQHTAQLPTRIISYPKTGRTWLKVLLGRYLCDHLRLPEELVLQTDRLSRSAGIGSLGFSHDGAAMTRGLAWWDLDPDKQAYRQTRVILLAREVKDTLVSCYFQATRRAGVFEGPISEFIRNEHFGVRKIVTFYRHWHENRHMPQSFHVVRYEDLHKNPSAILNELLSFLGLTHINRDLVHKAVEFASFDNMQQMERQNRFRNPKLAPGTHLDPDSYKVRVGKVGNYNHYLKEADILYVDECVATTAVPWILPASPSE